MADLTKQQSIKLLTINKFRISAASTARTRNLTHRSIQVNQLSSQKHKNQSTSKYPQSENFKKALYKIGALQKQDLSLKFIPNEEDHQSFRKRRLKSLRQKFFKTKCQEQQSQPYNDQLIDQAALDCWNYGQKSSQKGVWRRYRQNFHSLNFNTLKMIGKKRVY